MHALIQKLVNEGPIITDGAWGTAIQNKGLAAGASGEEWNLTHPDQVQEVPQAYIEAGSQIVITNTFGGNRYILKKFGLENKVAEINRAGVRISQKAVGESGALVFASMGPTGKMLVMKEVTEADLTAAFEEQAQALAEEKPDAIVVETMSDSKEALIAIQAAKATGLPVVGCVTFDSGPEKDRNMMGETAPVIARKFEDAGVDVIGSNCGQGIEGFIGICQQYREVTNLPLWVKANAGLPQFVDGKTVFKTKPEEFAKHVPALIEAGANFIGGCCGTNPEFIKAVVATINN